MNINRDYLVILDVKRSTITLGNGVMTFKILDKNTSNIFINLVMNTSSNPLINNYVNIENTDSYTVSMNILKPNKEYLTLEAKLHNKEEAIYEIDLPSSALDIVGVYRCEFLTKCTINGKEEITTSNEISYTVQKSIFTK